MIEASRVRSAPYLVRLVVSVDPAVSAGDSSAETGIIAAGIDMNGHAYILEDASLRGSPHQWASRAVALFNRHGADRIIAEANNGGEMVAHTLRTVESSLPITLVHASRGKYIRAEPISALYERGLVHHVGTFPLLEDQLCAWLPGHQSPDRLDALVWALTELLLDRPTDAHGYDANPFYAE
jgi:phage terminase large subunit-like protein